MNEQQLRDRIAELEDLLGLTAELPRHVSLRDAGVRRDAARLLGLLLRRNFVSKFAAYDALFGARPDCEQPEPKIIDVYLCQLRSALSPHGIEIATHWGDGFSMSLEHKEKLRRLWPEFAAGGGEGRAAMGGVQS